MRKILILLLSLLICGGVVDAHHARGAATLSGGSSIPTLVQHVVWQSNQNSETGNAFKFQLPNATLANNLLVFKMFYPSGATISSITDNVGNSWPTTPNVVATDTGNNIKVGIFLVPGATAGATQITVTFSAAQFGINPAFEEWYNVATASPLDGSHTAFNVGAGGAGTQSIASGSFNTTVNGDLILHFGADTGWGVQGRAGQFDKVTVVTKASGYALSQVDLNQAYFSEYQVQTTAGATNPSAGVTDTSANSGWASVTLALKAASAGTAPSATAMRIVGVMHTTLNGSGATGNHSYPVQFPTTGNTFVATVSDPPNSITLVSVSGTASGSWTTASTQGSAAQICHVESATASTDEMLSWTLNDATDHGYVSGILYDIAQGGAFDTSVNTVGSTSFGPGNSTPAVSLTPGVAKGMVIVVFGLNTGPPDSVVTPSGALFQSTFYTGESDLSPMDNGDFHAVYTYTTNATQSWVLHDTANTSGYGSNLVSIASLH